MTRTMTRLPEKYSFPTLETASTEGLLAIGGDLDPERILSRLPAGNLPLVQRRTADTVVVTKSESHPVPTTSPDLSQSAKEPSPTRLCHYG